jgi:hypothetical protein
MIYSGISLAEYRISHCSSVFFNWIVDMLAEVAIVLLTTIADLNR